MPDASLTLQQQLAGFAAHLRQPENIPPPGIEERRLAIYRQLFFNNMAGFLAKGFPVLKSLFSEEEWLGHVRHFYAGHTCHTPYFPQLGKEFVAWLQVADNPVAKQFAFAAELAHYEWVEAVLEVADAELPETCMPMPVTVETALALSPLALPLAYPWPVHRICQDFLPDNPTGQPTCLVAYRNRQEQVKFLECSPATLAMLQILAGMHGANAFTLLEALAQSLSVPVNETFLQQGLENLALLHSLDIVICQ